MQFSTHTVLFCYSCRPVGLPFYIGFIVPFGIIYVFNWLLFLLIIVSLCKRDLKNKKIKGQVTGKQTAIQRAELKKYFIITISLSINFGLGWIIGLLATSELGVAHLVFVYLFSIFVALQGILIFVLHCLRVPAARTTWKYWFYRIFCCKSQSAVKQSTRSTAPTPFSTPYNRRKVPLGFPIENSKPSKSTSFQKYFEESEASGEVIANPLQGVSEADTDITKETFIPDLSPYNDFDNDLPDYTYAVVDKSKKRKKKSSTAKEEARSGGKKTSRQEKQKNNRNDSLYYSVGEMSMESQALEVEFEPESGSEDEAEEWKRLQETLKDIHLAVDSDRNDFELDVVY